MTLVVGISLVLMLVLSACAPQETTPPPTTPPPTTPPPATQPPTQVEVDKIYKVLNPMGTYVPVETHPLSARLDSLAGKKILYYQSEANPVIMPVLLPRLKQDYPTATFDVVVTEGFGRSTPNDSDKTYQAAIRGVSW